MEVRVWWYCSCDAGDSVLLWRGAGSMESDLWLLESSHCFITGAGGHVKTLVRQFNLEDEVATTLRNIVNYTP
jgi:hypothetical protein